MTTTTSTTTTAAPTPVPPTPAPTAAPPTPAPSDNFTQNHILQWCRGLTGHPFLKCTASTVCVELNGKCYPSCYRANHSYLCHWWPNCEPLVPGPGCAPKCMDAVAVWPQNCDATYGCSKPLGSGCKTYITEEMPITGVQATASIWYMCQELGLDQCARHSRACVRFNGRCFPSCSASNHSSICASWIHCAALDPASAVDPLRYKAGRCRLKCEAIGTENNWCEWASVGGGCTRTSTGHCVSMVSGPVESCAAWANNASLPQCFPTSGCSPFKGACRPTCDRNFPYGPQTDAWKDGFGACEVWGHCAVSYVSPITGRVVCRPRCEILNSTDCRMTSDCVYFNGACSPACHLFNTSESCVEGKTHCRWNANPRDMWRDGVVGVVNQCQPKCQLAQNGFACEHLLGGGTSKGPLYTTCVWVLNHTVDDPTVAAGTVPMPQVAVRAQCADLCITHNDRATCAAQWHCQWVSTGCIQRCERAMSEQQCTEATGFRDSCMYVKGQCLPHCVVHGPNGTACAETFQGVCDMTAVLPRTCNIKRCDFMQQAQCMRPAPRGYTAGPTWTPCMFYQEKCQFSCEAALRMSDREAMCPDIEIAGTKLCFKTPDPVDATKKQCVRAGCHFSPGSQMCVGRSACSWLSTLNACNETCSAIPWQQCSAARGAIGCSAVATSYFAPADGALRVETGCAPACSVAATRESCNSMRGIAVNTGAPPSFQPPACFWHETLARCVTPCFRLSYLGGAACNAASHCEWNFARIGHGGGRCVFKCEQAASQTACNDRSTYQMDGACTWNPAASACERSCPYRHPTCTTPCVLSTSAQWGADACMPPSESSDVGTGWMPMPSVARPAAQYAVTYVAHWSSEMTHNEMRIAVLNALGVDHWAADEVAAASYDDRYRTVIAFNPARPNAALLQKRAANLSSTYMTILRLRCQVEGVVSGCPTAPPPPPMTTTPAPNTQPAITFWLLPTLNASRAATGEALLSKLAEVLKIPVSELGIVPTSPDNNTVTIAFYGKNQYQRMDTVLAMTEAELAVLGAAKVTVAEGSPPRPVPPVQSDAYIVVASVIGALFLIVVVAMCIFLLRPSDKDKKEHNAAADEAQAMAAAATAATALALARQTATRPARGDEALDGHPMLPVMGPGDPDL